MAETILFFIILLVGMGPILILGIVQYRSREPVGFWSGERPPCREEITDVQAYNRKHGLMWMLYGTGAVLCFVCGLPFGGQTAAYLCMFEVVGGIPAVIIYHNRLIRLFYHGLEKRENKKSGGA